MADQDEYRIKVSLDTTQARDGVRGLAEDTGRIGGAVAETAQVAEKEAEGFDASVFRNRRNVLHLLHGLLELREGGSEAIAGLATETHIASEAFESMLGPIGAVLGAVSLLVSIGIPLFDKYEEKQEKAKEKTDDLKSANDELKESIEEQGKAAEDALNKVVAKEKEEIEALAKSAEFYQQRVESLTKQIDLQQQIAELVLKTAETQELSKNTGGEAGENAIRLKYEKLQQDTKERTDFEKIGIEKTATLTANNGLADQARSNQSAHDEILKRQADEQARQDAAKAAESELEAQGLKYDKKKGAVVDDKGEDAVAAAKEEVATATANNEATKADIGNVPQSYLDEAQKALDDATANLSRLTAAQAKVMAGDGGAALENIDKELRTNEAALADIAAKERENAAKFDQLTLEEQKLRAQGALDAVTNTKKQEDDDQKNLRTARDNELKARLDSLEAKMAEAEKSKATPQHMAELDKQKASLEKEANTNKANDELGVKVQQPAQPNTDGPTSTNTKDILDQSVQDRTAAENKKIDTTTDASIAKANVEALKKSETEAVDQIKSQVDSSGNKAAITAFKQVQEKDRGDINQLLLDIVALFGKQEQFNKGILGALHTHGMTLDQHTGAIRSATNGGGFQ